MKILAIETSCDETAIALIEADTVDEQNTFTVLGNSVSSQAELHSTFGGVFPALAKREHTKNIIPVLMDALHGIEGSHTTLSEQQTEKIKTILSREAELSEEFLEKIPSIKKPDIDIIAVTTGPGLAPALWVGVSFAKALSVAWNVPLIPVNHMEGHIVSPLLTEKRSDLFPALSLLISGGHTELVLVDDFGMYKKIGETRDDAAGEAFDKVARMLDLPYPGGPKISKLAREHREAHPDWKSDVPLPRPMIKTHDYDFSFSGLKTAVLYRLKELPESDKSEIARDFEEAVTEVLLEKTFKAIDEYNTKTLLVGGGVAANAYIREQFLAYAEKYEDLTVLFPLPEVTTDNAIMIGMAAYIEYKKNKNSTLDVDAVVADGGLKI